MPDWTDLKVNLRWWIGLIGILLWTVPPCVWSQDRARSEQASSSAGQPFAGFDDSLTEAADRLLVVDSQTVISPMSNTDIGKGPIASPAVGGVSESLPSDGGKFAVAAMRVHLLRPTVEPILRRHGVPADFVAIIVVESGGQVAALSPKGARGLWQLMPDTARRYGLRVDEMRDDRLDPFLATDAAARYLRDLYTQFGDWKLALAAYNTGEANVVSAILKAHSQDFDQLSSLRTLPLETRNYVPRVLAAARLLAPSSSLGVDLVPASATPIFAASSY